MSESSEPALKRTTFLAAILISLPVCGFLPFLAALEVIAKVPKPTKVNLSPAIRVAVTPSTTASKAAVACAFVK